MLTVNDLLARHADWAEKNFPQSDPSSPLFGCVEELGEIAHSFLKKRQGIRGTPEEHEAKMRDGVGDLIFFLNHFCALQGWTLHQCLCEAWREVEKRDWQADPESGNAESP